MADEEHVHFLIQGTSVWNEWRKENPSIVPDLSGVNLTQDSLLDLRYHEIDLSGANLRGAELRGVSLGGAKLINVILDNANLGSANLRYVDLRGAKLNNTFLGGADLSHANLSHLDFTSANLISAKCEQADFTGADLSGKYLSNVDLTEAVLVRAKLRGAFLPDAKLNRAVLIESDLTDTSFQKGELIAADLSGAQMSGASLWRAVLLGAKLKKANLQKANLTEANLQEADVSGATLSEAVLRDADLRDAKLESADLSHANLELAHLVSTDLAKANLVGCLVYGISAWDLCLKGSTQSDLVITPTDEPRITADNLEVAQFIYLLLNNEKIRDVIQTVTSRAVLILGRFTAERKLILDSLRNTLRRTGYVPILFDFPPSPRRDLTETIQLLANMAKFVIADLTEAKSIPQELSNIIPFLPSVPIQPIILASERIYSMYEHWKGFK